MVLREKCSATHEPNAGPAAMPRLPVTPSSPIASPRLPSGTISATNAAVAVGLKPVLNPCSSRKNRKLPTVSAHGYASPHTTQTSEPNTITGMRPTVSESLPENGRENGRRQGKKRDNEALVLAPAQLREVGRQLGQQ